jgi:mannosyltransferase
MKRASLTSVASVLLLLIVAAGTVLRLHFLTKRDLWVDEALGVVLAGLPWQNFWQALWEFQANMGLYYLLLRGWLHLGDSEATVRGLSVLFGVAAIGGTYLLGKRIFGEKAAIASAALSAVNVFQIRYSQEARGYSLVMLLAVLSTYFFVRALDSPNRKRYWVGYVFASAFGVYVHLFAYLVIAAHWLSTGHARLRLLPRQTLLLAASGFILLTAPIDAFILFQGQGQLSWVPRPTAQLVLAFSKFFTGNGGIPLVGAYAALCLVALFWPAASEASRTSSLDEQWSAKLVATWLFFPIASTLLVSFFEPVFYDRFMAVSAPALALLAGQGMAKLDRVWLRLRGLFPTSLLVMLGLSLWGVYRHDSSSASQGDEWRQVTNYILAGQQPGDAVFFYRASGDWPFEYYAHREMELHGVAAAPKVVFPLDVTNPQQEPDEQQARLLIQGQKRVWLVLQHYEGLQERQSAMQAIQGALHYGYRISQQQVFNGMSGPIRVVLYVPD